MDTYLITDESEALEVEAFTNFKLSAKKVKSTTWFQYEPQRLEFTVYGNNGLSGETWVEKADLLFQRLLMVFNFPDNNYKGMSRTKIKLKKNGSVIFTGYIDITQSKINEPEQRADFVCYDILKVISLLSDEYVPYGKYTFGEFLNNSFYPDLGGFDWDLSGKLNRLGFTPTLSLLANTVNDEVTEYIYEGTNEFNYVYSSENLKGFYIYTDTQYGRALTHLFFVYFQVNLLNTDIYKNVKIFEIVNGYCPVDAIYVREGGYISYSTAAEASANIDSQINEEIDNINNSIHGWGDWFHLGNIQSGSVVFDGYTYGYDDSDNNLLRRISVTGNIFPTVVNIGDNKKYHRGISGASWYYLRPNYSQSSWVEVFKDFLIGNNLVMKVTASGNIEISNIGYDNAIDITNDLIKLERKIQLVAKFDGLGSLDGNTDAMIDNFSDYYYNYLKLLNTYDIQVNTDVIENISRELDVLRSFSYFGKYFLVLKIDNDLDGGKYDCECIGVS